MTCPQGNRHKRDAVGLPGLLSSGFIILFSALALFPPYLHPLVGALATAVVIALVCVSTVYAPESLGWTSLRQRPMFYPVLAILVLGASSLVVSPCKWNTLESFNQLFLACLVYLIAPRVFGGSRWKFAVGCLASIAILMGTKAIVEWAMGPQQLIALYEQNRHVVSERLYEDIMRSLEQGRALAVYGNPNHLASALTLLLPMIWVLAAMARTRMLKAACLFLALPSLGAIYASYSRAGLLMVFLVILVSLWLLISRKPKGAEDNGTLAEPEASTSERRGRLIVWVAAVCIVFVALGLFVAAKGLLGGRLLVISTLKARGEFYLAAWKMIQASPLLGHGLGTYAILYPQFRLLGGVEAQYAHSLFLQVWVEGGILYLLAWTVFCAVFGWRALRCLLRAPKDNWTVWQSATAMGGLLLLLHSQIDFVNNLTFFLTFLLVAASQLELRQPGPDWPRVPSEKTISRIIAVVLVIALGSHWYFLVYRPSIAEGDFQLALLLVGEGKPVEALELYQNAFSGNPINPLHAEHLALTYLNLDLPEQAERFALKAISLDPLTPHLRQSLGRVYARMGNFDLAVRQYKKASELHPNKPDYHRELAALYRRIGKADLAQKEEEIATQVDKGYSGSWEVEK